MFSFEVDNWTDYGPFQEKAWGDPELMAMFMNSPPGPQTSVWMDIPL
jgi:hypothetical protein